MLPASSPTWAPSFARGLSSAQDFLGAQALPPPLAWSHCPSDWLPILWFVALSPLSLMLLMHCSSLALSTGTMPWERFSPHPLWPGPLGLGLEYFLFPALAPWTPRGSRPDSFSSPLMGEQPKMSRKARHYNVLVWPMSLSQGKVGQGGTLKVTLESETAAWRL